MITSSQIECGRLGNQLFVIAAVIGAAKANNTNYLFPEGWKNQSGFRNPLPTSPDILWDSPNACNYYEIFHSYYPIVGEHLNIKGFFQSEKYFANVSKEVAKYLIPTDEVINVIQNKYDKILSEFVTCSIHIRRGDYVGHMAHGFDVVTPEYYQKAIELAVAGGVEYFLICSDDVPWLEENLEDWAPIFKNVSYEIVKYPKCSVDNIFLDFFTMAACYNHIIPNSTFGWWSAWYGQHCKGGVVIAPKRWFNWGLAHLDTKDIVPEHWIKL